MKAYYQPGKEAPRLVFEHSFDGFRLDKTPCELGYATVFIYMATKTHKGTTERASMAKNTANYGNDSIRQLKDEERVRLRPAVIFGSDGLDGCAHAAFEILSNAVDLSLIHI